MAAMGRKRTISYGNHGKMWENGENLRIFMGFHGDFFGD
jgi:hypothetical protein